MTGRLVRIGLTALALAALAAVGAAPGAVAKKKKKKPKTTTVTKTATVNTCVNAASPILSPDAPGGPVVGRAQIPVNIPTLRGAPQSGSVTALNSVDVRITHTFDSDLAIFLISPGGTAVPLALGRGGGNDDYGTGLTSCSGTRTFFGDAFTTPISMGTAPFAGFFKPETPLSTFVGGAAGGTWTLLAIDQVGGDNGVLHAFSLDLAYSYQELVKKKKRKKKR